jgi:hypothetical protein
MQSIVDSSLLIFLSVGFVALLLFIANQVAKRHTRWGDGIFHSRFQRGSFVFFMACFVIFLFLTGWVGLVLTATLADAPMVLYGVFVAMGIAISILTMCFSGSTLGT